MVFNENIDMQMHSIDEVDLYEPVIWKIRIRKLCYPIALIFVLEDVVQLYLIFINYFGREEPYYSHVDIPLNFALRSLTILTAVLLIYGLRREHSTPITIFLWTIFEVNIIYVIFYCYKSIYGLLDNTERFKEYGVLIIKAILWWVVNTYHNFVKEKEIIIHGKVRVSNAFTVIRKYRLAYPNNRV